MALSAAVDTSTNPFTLTVTSEPSRAFGGTVTITAQGETASAPYSGTWPLTVTDDSGRVWTLESDNGSTAIFRG